MSDNELRLIPSGDEGLVQRSPEAPHDLLPDVRSTVESQFRRMDQVHNRIRAEELAARLPAHTID